MNIAHDHSICLPGQAPGRYGDAVTGGSAAGTWPQQLIMVECNGIGAAGARAIDGRQRGDLPDCTITVATAYAVAARPVNLDASSNRKPGDDILLSVMPVTSAGTINAEMTSSGGRG